MSRNQNIIVGTLVVAMYFGASMVCGAVPTTPSDSATWNYGYEFDKDPFDPLKIDLDVNTLADWQHEGTPVLSGTTIAFDDSQENLKANGPSDNIFANITDAYTLEFSVKSGAQTGGHSSTGVMVVSPSTENFIAFYIAPGDQRWKTGGGSSWTMLGTNDNTDKFHVFRIAKEAGAEAYWVWRDNVLLNPAGALPEALPLSTPHDFMAFHHFGGDAVGYAEYDYVRLTPGAFAPIPEPSQERRVRTDSKNETPVASSAAAAPVEVPWINPRCTPLPTDRPGPFAVLSDGSLIALESNEVVVSKDDGKTWSESERIYDGPGPGIPSGGLFLRTRDGVIVHPYLDTSTLNKSWKSEDWSVDPNAPLDRLRLDAWTIRSLDEGKTWVDRQKIYQGFCGALCDIVQTTSGEIVLPVQVMLAYPGRNGIRGYVSADNGKTWKRGGNIIDLGGHGHHDGAMEPTLVELSDGRLWMLIRTNLDRFWEAYSEDKGLNWRVIRPTQIDASNSPGNLMRLASGRLALVWNRLYYEGWDYYPHKTPGFLAAPGKTSGFTKLPANFNRAEVWLAFSEDDGKTWTKPVVITHCRKQKYGQLAYLDVFERRPGELWVTTRKATKTSRACMSLLEREFAGVVQDVESSVIPKRDDSTDDAPP